MDVSFRSVDSSHNFKSKRSMGLLLSQLHVEALTFCKLPLSAVYTQGWLFGNLRTWNFDTVESLSDFNSFPHPYQLAGKNQPIYSQRPEKPVC